ncbi:MAG TPA: helix-turn-helix domain-containing protein [Acidimicrobiales bacterium]|nr:helix-turn-helix domain-containing protein [Acidimicrobiales bacterium]
MQERKSYRQFCGLARALDRIGDRWTLLVVRELLLGPRPFRALEDGLPGISTAVLARRLAALVSDGLVERSAAPKRSKAVEYRLTEAGRELEPVVLALVKWGGRWMLDGPGSDRVDPAWAPLALRALIEGTPARGDGVVHIDVSGCDITIVSRHGRRSVVPGRPEAADAKVMTELPLALAVAAGEMRLVDTDARISGRASVAAALLQPTASRVRKPRTGASAATSSPPSAQRVDH